MIGKWILIFGVVLVVVGAVVWLVESLGLPLGRLPGDIRMRGEGWSFSFPIVTLHRRQRRADGAVEPVAVVLAAVGIGGQ